jgi:hypothetical protein
MSIQKCVRIKIRAVADGESTQFACDLATDPYWVGETTSTGAGGDITNWEPTMVTDVMMVSGALGANMAGAGSTAVIIDVAVANAGTVYEVILDVISP